MPSWNKRFFLKANDLLSPHTQFDTSAFNFFFYVLTLQKKTSWIYGEDDERLPNHNSRSHCKPTPACSFFFTSLWMVDHHPLTFTFSSTSLAHTYFILISVMTSLKGKGCEVWRCIQSQLFKSTLPVTCPDIRSAESLQLVSDPGPAGFK